MAKGVEDTTFYCFDRLVSCNEVGAQASLVGISADRFHEFCHYLSERWPNNMLATSTHDNKRSEDVRTRISILSEIPERWSEALHAWSQINAAAWRNRTPDRHAEYLLVSNPDRRVAHLAGALLAVHAEGLPRGEDQDFLA
jgi:(1->4)-alpha-D-glucan 1-alpha-D-glucosylmutase